MSQRHSVTALVVALVVAASCRAGAQDTVKAQPGDRVRIRGEGESSAKVRRLIDLDGDSLWLRSCTFCSVHSRSRRSVASIDVSRERVHNRSTIFRSAMIGLLVTTVPLVIDIRRSAAAGNELAGVGVILVVPAAVIGFTGGALVGYAIRSDVWAPATLPP